MMMKGISIFLLSAFFALMQPPQANARTSVYLSVSIGSVAIVGGVYLFWSITYGSRVGGIEPAPKTSATSALPWTSPEREIRTLSSPLFSTSPDEPEGVTITWPVLIYRW